jgi:hypothetical protein
MTCAATRVRKVDWVIVGGESGPGARPCDLAWIRSIRDQCREAGTAFFCKQLGRIVRSGWIEPDELGWRRVGFRVGGGWADYRLKDAHGGNMAEWPEDLRVREFPNTTPAVQT